MNRGHAFAALSLGAIGLACYAWLGSGAEPNGDEGLIVDRVWIDSKPDKYTDYANLVYFVGRTTTGLFERASAYDFHMQLVEYARDGGSLKLVFPQTGEQASVAFAIRACSDLPPFDLCLDLQQNPWGGPKRYHGLRDRDDEERELGERRRRILSDLGPDR